MIKKKNTKNDDKINEKEEWFIAGIYQIPDSARENARILRKIKKISHNNKDTNKNDLFAWDEKSTFKKLGEGDIVFFVNPMKKRNDVFSLLIGRKIDVAKMSCLQSKISFWDKYKIDLSEDDLIKIQLWDDKNIFIWNQLIKDWNKRIEINISSVENIIKLFKKKWTSNDDNKVLKYFEEFMRNHKKNLKKEYYDQDIKNIFTYIKKNITPSNLKSEYNEKKFAIFEIIWEYSYNTYFENWTKNYNIGSGWFTYLRDWNDKRFKKIRNCIIKNEPATPTASTINIEDETRGNDKKNTNKIKSHIKFLDWFDILWINNTRLSWKFYNSILSNEQENQRTLLQSLHREYLLWYLQQDIWSSRYFLLKILRHIFEKYINKESKWTKKNILREIKRLFSKKELQKIKKTEDKIPNIEEIIWLKIQNLPKILKNFYQKTNKYV